MPARTVRRPAAAFASGPARPRARSETGGRVERPARQREHGPLQEPDEERERDAHEHHQYDGKTRDRQLHPPEPTGERITDQTDLGVLANDDSAAGLDKSAVAAVVQQLAVELLSAGEDDGVRHAEVLMADAHAGRALGRGCGEGSNRDAHRQDGVARLVRTVGAGKAGRSAASTVLQPGWRSSAGRIRI